MGLGLDGDFFASNDPPAQEEIVATSAISQLKQRLALDFTEKSRGRIRLVFGQRGFGKSTSLAYVIKVIRSEYHESKYVEFNAGLYTNQMSQLRPEEAVALFVEKLALAISDGRERDIGIVLRKIAKLPGKHFLLIDNLDRLYSKQSDLDLVKRLFEQADPIFKDLVKHFVIVITAAPEWDSVVQTNDLSYLNFPGSIRLQGMSKEELRQAIQFRLQTRSLKVEDLFEKGFLDAILVACSGSPRIIFQTLETFNGPDAPIPPLRRDHFLANHQDGVDKGIVDVSTLIIQKTHHAPGHKANALAKLNNFFDIVGRSPKEIHIASRQIEESLTKGLREDQVVHRNAWGAIAERTEGSKFRLRPEIAAYLGQLTDQTGMPLAMVLNALARFAPEAAMGDLDGFDRKYRRSLGGTSLEAYEEAYDSYLRLGETSFEGRTHATIVADAWTCVSGLMLAIHALAGILPNIEDLRSRLVSTSSFATAMVDLIDGTNRVYAASGRGYNAHSEELRMIGSYRKTLNDQPEKANVYARHQMDGLRHAARFCFEAMLRQLTPSQLVNIRQAHLGEIHPILANGEDEVFEFKSAFRFNPSKPHEPDYLLESRCLEAICAMANTDGGTLLLGVGPDHSIVGIRGDMNASRSPDADGFQLTLRSRLEHRLPEALGRTKVRVVHAEGLPIAIVEVSPPKGRAMELRMNHPGSDPAIPKKFMVRTGNRNKELKGEEIQRWLEEHKLRL